jgi:hypothetical protein
MVICATCERRYTLGRPGSRFVAGRDYCSTACARNGGADA